MKQNDGEAKSSEMQDEVTVLPNVNSELALAELEAFTCALLHPTTHNSGARREPRIESNAIHQSRLPLAELEAFTGTLLSVLLAFFGAGVAGEEALALQLLAQFNVELQQGAGNAHL